MSTQSSMIRGNGVYYDAEMSELVNGPSADELITIRRADWHSLQSETLQLGQQVAALQTRLGTLSLNLTANELAVAAQTAGPTKLTHEAEMVQLTIRHQLEPLVKHVQHGFEERIEPALLHRPTVPQPPVSPATADLRSEYMYGYGQTVEWWLTGEDASLYGDDTLSYHYTYVPGADGVQAADIAVVRVEHKPKEAGVRQKTQIASLQLTNDELTKLTVENLSQITNFGTVRHEAVSTTIDLTNLRYFERLPHEQRAASYTYDSSTRLFINDHFSDSDLDLPRLKPSQEVIEDLQTSLRGLLALC